MKIAVDVTSFDHGLTSGTPVYMFNLLGALFAADGDDQFVLVYGHTAPTPGDGILEELVDRSAGRATVRRTPLFHGKRPAIRWWVLPQQRIRALAGDVDVFHAGDFIWPSPDTAAAVITIQDLTTLRYPQHHLWVNRYRDRRRLHWTRRHADRVIAASSATKQDLVCILGCSAGIIDVVHHARGLPGVADRLPGTGAQVRKQFGLGEDPYILTVGTLEPRKNHVRLIRAFEGIADVFPAVRMAIVGAEGWKAGAVTEVLASSRVAERIHWLRFVSSEDLAALYQEAMVFAYPSLYEGFGLPLLEAMAAGVPVLTSRVSSLPEVAGYAALLVDPESVDAIRMGLQRLLQDPQLRNGMAQRGRLREAQFSWEKTAALTLETYRRAVEMRTRRNAATA